MLDEFYRSATLIASPAPVQVFVNSETQTEPAALRRPGFTVVTHHDDPLDFSGSHKLLLRSVDVLRADGIDDWTLESRTDGASVLQCVTELTTTPPTRLAWHAIGGQSRFRIQKRLENLHIQLHAALQESGDRFVFPFGRDIVCATFDDGAVATTRHASEADLRTKLRTARARRTTFGRDSARLSAFN